MSQSVVGAGMGLKRGPNGPRSEAHNPIVNQYRTKDGRWIALCLLFDAWWPDLARHLGRPDLLEDPRFADGKARRANNQALIAEFDKIFAEHDYAVWLEKLKTLQGVWAPLQSPEEVMNDPQARENGFVTKVRTDDGREYFGGASPAQFDERPIGDLRAAPTFAAHTDAVMRELGITEAQIAGLREKGVVR